MQCDSCLRGYPIREKETVPRVQMCTCKRPRNNDILILGRVFLLHLAVGNLANLFISILNINICILNDFAKDILIKQIFA